MSTTEAEIREGTRRTPKPIGELAAKAVERCKDESPEGQVAWLMEQPGATALIEEHAGDLIRIALLTCVHEARSKANQRLAQRMAQLHADLPEPTTKPKAPAGKQKANMGGKAAYRVHVECCLNRWYSGKRVGSMTSAELNAAIHRQAEKISTEAFFQRWFERLKDECKFKSDTSTVFESISPTRADVLYEEASRV